MPRRTFVLRRAGLAVLLLVTLGAYAAARDTSLYPNTNGFGVAFDSAEDWHRQCMRIAYLAPFPAYATAPALEEPYTETTHLYYVKRGQATTTAAEWRRVREQALAVGDDAVLMMLYANGYQLKRI
jgi:hypothetical protein